MLLRLSHTVEAHSKRKTAENKWWNLKIFPTDFWRNKIRVLWILLWLKFVSCIEHNLFSPNIYQIDSWLLFFLSRHSHTHIHILTLHIYYNTVPTKITLSPIFPIMEFQLESSNEPIITFRQRFIQSICELILIYWINIGVDAVENLRIEHDKGVRSPRIAANICYVPLTL